jgi:hypothetical protein
MAFARKIAVLAVVFLTTSLSGAADEAKTIQLLKAQTDGGKPLM